MSCANTKEISRTSYELLFEEVSSLYPDWDESAVRRETAVQYRPRYYQDQASARVENSGMREYFSTEFTLTARGTIYFPGYKTDLEKLHQNQLKKTPEQYSLTDHQTSRLIQHAFANGATEVVTSYAREGSDNRDIIIMTYDPILNKGTQRILNTAVDGGYHTYDTIRQLAKNAFANLEESSPTARSFILTDIPLPPEQLNQEVQRTVTEAGNVRTMFTTKSVETHRDEVSLTTRTKRQLPAAEIPIASMETEARPTRKESGKPMVSLAISEGYGSEGVTPTWVEWLRLPVPVTLRRTDTDPAVPLDAEPITITVSAPEVVISTDGVSEATSATESEHIESPIMMETLNPLLSEDHQQVLIESSVPTLESYHVKENSFSVVGDTIHNEATPDTDENEDTSMWEQIVFYSLVEPYVNEARAIASLSSDALEPEMVVSEEIVSIWIGYLNHIEYFLDDRSQSLAVPSRETWEAISRLVEQTDTAIHGWIMVLAALAGESVGGLSEETIDQDARAVDALALQCVFQALEEFRLVSDDDSRLTLKSDLDADDVHVGEEGAPVYGLLATIITYLALIKEQGVMSSSPHLKKKMRSQRDALPIEGVVYLFAA